MPLPVLSLALLLAVTAQERPGAPGDVLVGVSYVPAPPGSSDAGMRQDLERLRRSGFNLIVLPATRGNVDRLVGIAVEADLTIRAEEEDDRGDLTRIPWEAGARGLQEARLAFWSAIAAGSRAIYFTEAEKRTRQELLALGETAGVVTRNQALFRQLRPREGGVRSIEDGEAVEVRLLESSDALLIVGLNKASGTRKVTILFEPEIPEAIWQNFETGTSVSFVMEKDGPFLEHTFAPRDALVLMVRKRYRR